MGINFAGKLVNFNSNKMESVGGDDLFGGTTVTVRIPLVCTTLDNVMMNDDVWLTAYIEWLALRRSSQGNVSETQKEYRFEIWRNFGESNEHLVCSTSDANGRINDVPSRTTTTITCVDKNVPVGTHTYCYIVVIPPSEGVGPAGDGIRAFNREITAAEIVR
ncbi:hypothetical protein [Ammoniphilus sp. CFH 90114]|uniref:hypothetical protein n=1 Tax=Ammoniphilus sp. CFH 90114 TaxID=2493665 RepID=UPI00100EF852|nr:hypothetical protein [Ammoniphilus sp. CFH 90114]RXT06984.1 hypothetical protein EIZ39_12560 [Ammoniphilus sp. CFH 90114]